MNKNPEQLGRKEKSAKVAGNIEFKIRSVFVPYLAIATAFTIFYSLLHWLLIANTEVPILEDDVANFILPVCLPWLLIMLWFRHRIKLLKWPKRNDASLGYVVAWITFAVPTIIAQEYLGSAVGDLTHLERISQIGAKPHTKYYTVRELAVDKSHARRRVLTFSSGRHSENWNVDVYYAIPLLDSGTKFDPNHSTAWLGMPYPNRASNRLSQEDKRAYLTASIRRSEEELNNNDFRWISYLATIGNNKERQALNVALENGTSFRIKPPTALLSAHAEAFESRTGSTLYWFFVAYGSGVGVWLLLALTMKVDAASQRQWVMGGSPTNEDLRRGLAMLIPRTNFFVTPILFDLNFVVWVAMVFCGLGIDSISAADLMSWAPSTHQMCRMARSGDR